MFLWPLSFTQTAFSKEVTPTDTQIILPTLIKVFNEGDRRAIKRYYQQNINPERIGIYGLKAHISRLLNQRAVHGKLTLVKALANKGNNERAKVIAQNSQLSYILTVNKSSNPPYQLNYFFLADTEDKPSANKITMQVMSTELSNFLNNLVKNNAFSGSVLIAKDNKVIFQEARGQANKNYFVANNLATKYSIGSMNKMFTAIATLQLIEQGKLSFEDKLISYVDSSWLPKEGGEAITIRQLLTHTSGLGSFFNEAYLLSDKASFRTLVDYKPLIANTPLLFPPGTRSRYSNSGMHMLGLVIEKASGQDYFDYVEQHIYHKADMPNSNSFARDAITPNLAVGYLKHAHSDTWVSNDYFSAVKGGPAGGGYSTVIDLFHFSKALTQFKLLGKELTEQAYSNKVQFNSSPRYGYGFGVYGDKNNRVVGHVGATLGVDARLDIHLDTGFIVVILANQHAAVAPVRRKINALIAQQ